MVCKKCGTQLNEECAFCPKCGKKIKADRNPKAGKVVVGGLLLALLCGGAFLYASGYILPFSGHTAEEPLPDSTEVLTADNTDTETDIVEESAVMEVEEEEPNEIALYLESLTLEPVEMIMGETYQVELEKDIPDAVWSSSDEKIVKPAAGQLNAIAPGQADITLSAEGQDVSFHVSVNAFSDMTVAVDYSINLEMNDAISEIQWESSNPEIISVNDGVISALAAGASTVTVYVDGKDYSFEVVGTTPEITTTSVRKIIGNTEQISVLGTNGTVEWKSDNTAIATVSDTGLITAEPTGAGQNTVVHAYIDGMEFKIDVAVEPIPQLSSTYKIYGHQDDYDYKNANITLCANANAVAKLKAYQKLFKGKGQGKNVKIQK